MKSNFYGNRKSLLAVFICAAFLSGSHVAYAVNESLLVSAYQQPSKIKGTVIDANGEVVIGASVVVKGTANGTITYGRLLKRRFLYGRRPKGYVIRSICQWNNVHRKLLHDIRLH